jgi:hypothetical protein
MVDQGRSRHGVFGERTVPAVTRAMGARRKARIMGMECGGKEGEEGLDGVCKERLGIQTPS